MTPAELLAELKRLNIEVSLAGDKLHLEAPAGALTPEVKETIRQNKAALLTMLREQSSFDPDQAQQLFADTLARLNEKYPFGAIQWAQIHRPELWEACQSALSQVEATFKVQDMAAIREAITEFEKANLALFKTYPGLPWRPGQKGTDGREKIKCETGH